MDKNSVLKVSAKEPTVAAPTAKAFDQRSYYFDIFLIIIIITIITTLIFYPWNNIRNGSFADITLRTLRQQDASIINVAVKVNKKLLKFIFF